MTLKEIAKELHDQAKKFHKAAALVASMAGEKNGKSIVAGATRRFQADNRLHTASNRAKGVKGMRTKNGHYYYPSKNTLIVLKALQETDSGIAREELLARGFKPHGLGPLVRRQIVVEKKGIVMLGKRGAEVITHLQQAQS